MTSASRPAEGTKPAGRAAGAPAGRPPRRGPGPGATVRPAAAALLAACLLGAPGCRPDSVTGARDQISRTAPREVSYRVPVAREAYGAPDFLGDVDVRELARGVVGVPLPTDTLSDRIGDELAGDAEADVALLGTVEPADVELGEMGDALAGSTIRSAPLEVSLRNGSRAPLRLVGAALGLVRLEPDGTPVLDADGGPVLETDASGDPIRAPLADAPGDSLFLPPGGGVERSTEAAEVVDRVVEHAAAGRPAGVALLATARVAPDDLELVGPLDSLTAVYRAWIGLDLVLPDSGVVVGRRTPGDGVGLAPADADQVEQRVEQAGGRVLVENRLPFGVRVLVGYVPGDRPGVDVFSAPDRVVLDTLPVNGHLGGAAPADTLEVSLSGAEVRPLLGDDFTAGVRIRLVPPSGAADGRAIRVDDLVDVDARAFVDVRASEGSP